MRVRSGCAAGWLLVLLAVSLLLVRGQLAWLIVLFPLSLLLACGIMGPGGRRREPTPRNENE
jgi:hypothetical protein